MLRTLVSVSAKTKLVFPKSNICGFYQMVENERNSTKASINSSSFQTWLLHQEQANWGCHHVYNPIIFICLQSLIFGSFTDALGVQIGTFTVYCNDQLVAGALEFLMKVVGGSPQNMIERSAKYD